MDQNTQQSTQTKLQEKGSFKKLIISRASNLTKKSREGSKRLEKWVRAKQKKPELIIESIINLKWLFFYHKSVFLVTVKSKR